MQRTDFGAPLPPLARMRTQPPRAGLSGLASSVRGGARLRDSSPAVAGPAVTLGTEARSWWRRGGLDILDVRGNVRGAGGLKCLPCSCFNSVGWRHLGACWVVEGLHIALPRRVNRGNIPAIRRLPLSYHVRGEMGACYVRERSAPSKDLRAGTPSDRDPPTGAPRDVVPPRIAPSRQKWAAATSLPGRVLPGAGRGDGS